MNDDARALLCAGYDLQTALARRAHGFDEEPVFRFVNSPQQTIFVLPLSDGNGSLGHDRTGVHISCDEMYGATSNLRAIRERLPHRVHAREGRKERGVQVEDPHRVGIEKHVSHQSHEPREHDPVDGTGAKFANDRVIELLTRGKFTMRDAHCLDPSAFCPFQRADVGFVGDDHPYIRCERAVGYGIQKRLQIGAFPGNEHSESR